MYILTLAVLCASTTLPFAKDHKPALAFFTGGDWPGQTAGVLLSFNTNAEFIPQDVDDDSDDGDDERMCIDWKAALDVHQKKFAGQVILNLTIITGRENKFVPSHILCVCEYDKGLKRTRRRPSPTTIPGTGGYDPYELIKLIDGKRIPISTSRPRVETGSDGVIFDFRMID